MKYGVAEAKNNLPKLIKAALRGERVLIINRGCESEAVELVRVKVKGMPAKGFGSMPHLEIPAKRDVTDLFEEL